MLGDTSQKKDLVYDAILKSIIRKEYSHNSIITEKQLIEKYKVSKSPVREALIMLCNEGILMSLPRTGYMITPVNIKDLKDALALRILIEKAALTETFKHINAEDIAKLEVLERKEPEVNKTRDFYSHWSLNTKFHLTLCSFSGNKYFTNTLNNLLKTCFRGINGYYEKTWQDPQKEEIHYHTYIIKAMKENNLETALAFLEDDLSELTAFFKSENRMETSQIDNLLLV